MKRLPLARLAAFLFRDCLNFPEGKYMGIKIAINTLILFRTRQKIIENHSFSTRILFLTQR